MVTLHTNYMFNNRKYLSYWLMEGGQLKPFDKMKVFPQPTTTPGLLVCTLIFQASEYWTGKDRNTNTESKSERKMSGLMDRSGSGLS